MINSLIKNVKNGVEPCFEFFLYPLMILIVLIELLVETCGLHIRSLLSFYKFKSKFNHGVNKYIEKHEKYDIHIAKLAYGCLLINNHLDAIKKICDVEVFGKGLVDEIMLPLDNMKSDVSMISSLLSCTDNWLKDNRSIAKNLDKVNWCKILLGTILRSNSFFLKLCNDNNSIFNELRVRYRICIMSNFSRRIEYLSKFCLTNTELILKDRVNIRSSINQYICEVPSSVMQVNR